MIGGQHRLDIRCEKKGNADQGLSPADKADGLNSLLESTDYICLLPSNPNEVRPCNALSVLTPCSP
jgi:hypothetical protein